MKIMGIDPGFKGGISIYDYNGFYDTGSFFLRKMPVIKTDLGNELDYNEIYKLLEIPDVIYVEKAQSMPKNGARQSFKYGGGFFSLRCMISLLKKKVTYVNPQTWKKIILKDMDRSKKESSIIRVNQLFSEYEFEKMFGKISDGIADAILISEYGRMYETGLIVSK